MTLAEAPDVLTVAEAAQLLRIGRNQAYELINRGDLYAARIGRSIRVPKATLVAYLEGRNQFVRPELSRVS